MIFLLNHGGFLSSQGFVGNEIRKYIINGIIEDGHFLIYVLSMKSSFPVEFTNYLLNQINIRFLYAKYRSKIQNTQLNRRLLIRNYFGLEVQF